MHSGWDYTVEEVGINRLKFLPKEQPRAGEVGYIIAGIKSVREIEVGDTITHLETPGGRAGAGLPEGEAGRFFLRYTHRRRRVPRGMQKAMDKLAINDASLTYRERGQTRRPWASVSAAAFWASCTWT